MAVAHLACMAMVASFYHLPPRVLPSIQAIEGGRVGAVSRNRNGSEDLGVMQVNTLWLPAVARYTGLSQAEVRERLINRACFNIAVAGAIMRTYLDEANGDVLRAVGYYHSHTPGLHESYRLRVMSAASRLFQTPQAPRRGP